MEAIHLWWHIVGGLCALGVVGMFGYVTWVLFQ